MTSAGVLRVAAAQAESVSGDVPANVATAVSLVRAAARGGARLVVLPELFLTGYDVAAWTPEGCLRPDDAVLEPLRSAAREGAIAVVVGAAVAHEDGRHTLSVLVVAPDGTTTAPYDKQHLFADEREFFDAGDHGASITLDGWELGLGVCYDGCFPSTRRPPPQRGRRRTSARRRTSSARSTGGTSTTPPARSTTASTSSSPA
nr:carbon-nitrogen hydrolase family protein [Nocardioides mesophilus]